jgi:hypothetical protein
VIAIVAIPVYIFSSKQVLVSGEKTKIYPLCCDECRKHAEDILNIVKEANQKDLQVAQLRSYYYTKERPVGADESVKNAPEYLVMKIAAGKSLLNKNTHKFLEEKGLDSSKLMASDFVSCEASGIPIIQNLDTLISCPKYNV